MVLLYSGNSSIIPSCRARRLAFSITTGLYLLASQSLPSLVSQFNLKEDFPQGIYDPRLSDAQTKALENRRMKVLGELIREGRIGWWDVFDLSDIGKERNKLARKHIRRSSKVLDVGCGRGFFSFACSRIASEVTCVDLMNGLGRKGWWEEFSETASLLSVENTRGIRANGSMLPLRNDSFDAVSSIHAIRNFRSRFEIQSFFKEAFRVLKPNGRAVIAESELNANSFRAYKAFYKLRTRLKWELRLPRSDEITRWLVESGFRRVSSETHDWGLHYAPVYFPYGESILKGRKHEWELARDLIIRKGESHPPVRVFTAAK